MRTKAIKPVTLTTANVGTWFAILALGSPTLPSYVFTDMVASCTTEVLHLSNTLVLGPKSLNHTY